jgi:hypothetical protein
VTVWWPRARALLIGLAMVIGLVDGCPTPSGNQRKQLDPDTRARLDRIDELRHDVLRPVRKVRELTSITQKWNVFRGASAEKLRMRIEARAGAGDWIVLYRAGDDAHTFMADELAYRRIRGVWNPRSTGPRAGYGAFVTWIAREVFQRRPELDTVRVVMERIHITPGGVRSTGETAHPMTRRRRQVMR